MPSSDVTWIISRAFAGEWPYDPDQIEYRRHPSLSRRTSVISRFLNLPGNDDRTIQIAVETLRRTARMMLKGKDVRHIEVVPFTLDDYTSVLHEECQGEGCDECSGLGVLFAENKGSKVYLLGWLAVIRNGME